MVLVAPAQHFNGIACILCWKSDGNNINNNSVKYHADTWIIVAHILPLIVFILFNFHVKHFVLYVWQVLYKYYY